MLCKPDSLFDIRHAIPRMVILRFKPYAAVLPTAPHIHYNSFAMMGIQTCHFCTQQPLVQQDGLDMLDKCISDRHCNATTVMGTTDNELQLDKQPQNLPR